MKTYEICIKPTSDFVTPLKGDTMFGQLCWQFQHDPNLLNSSLENLLSDYSTSPFLIVSSAVISFMKDSNKTYLFKRPFSPPTTKIENKKNRVEAIKEFEKRKLRKAQKWVVANSKTPVIPGETDKAVNENDVVKLLALDETWTAEVVYRQPHNTIDRLAGTTGSSSAMAPFTQNVYSWHENTNLSIFIGLRDEINVSGLKTAFERIGYFGFGADASAGKGKFEVIGEIEEVNLAALGSKIPNAAYTLSPCLPQEDLFKNIYFEPFVRFGRHGDWMANSSTPFKKPVLMADEGAVLVFENDYKKPHIGKAITNVSYHKGTVTQGYSLYIPVNTGDQN